MGATGFNSIRLYGDSVTPDNTGVTALIYDDDGNLLLASGEIKPADSDSGYAVGCLFIKTDADTGDVFVYVNRGDSDDCAFEGVAEEVTLASGQSIYFADSNTYITSDGDEWEFVSDADLDFRIDGVIAREADEDFTLMEVTADDDIDSHRFCEIDDSGDLVPGSVNSDTVCGVNVSEMTTVFSGNEFELAIQGFTTVTADEAVDGGALVKCGDDGRVSQFVTTAMKGSVIKEVTEAGDFSNQPQDDGIEILSDDSADTSMDFRIWYSVYDGGATDEVLYEDVTTDASDGTTPVASTATDMNLVLGVEALTGGHAGTITIREASTNGEITTLATGTDSAGVTDVTGTDVRAFNVIPTVEADGASVKQIGLVGTGTDGSAQYDSQELDGTTTTSMNSAFKTVTKVLTGDVATGTETTVKVKASADNHSMRIGRAGPAGATARGEDCIVIF